MYSTGPWWLLLCAGAIADVFHGTVEAGSTYNVTRFYTPYGQTRRIDLRKSAASHFDVLYHLKIKL